MTFSVYQVISLQCWQRTKSDVRNHIQQGLRLNYVCYVQNWSNNNFYRDYSDYSMNIVPLLFVKLSPDTISLNLFISFQLFIDSKLFHTTGTQGTLRDIIILGYINIYIYTHIGHMIQLRKLQAFVLPRLSERRRRSTTHAFVG